jgi:hypothetical protein
MVMDHHRRRDSRPGSVVVLLDAINSAGDTARRTNHRTGHWNAAGPDTRATCTVAIRLKHPETGVTLHLEWVEPPEKTSAGRQVALR